MLQVIQPCCDHAGNPKLSSRYAFAPLGQARQVPIDGTAVRVIDGPLRKMVLVHGPPNEVAALQKLWLDRNEHGIHVQLDFDISNTTDYELAVRWDFDGVDQEVCGNQTDAERFYTDSNGFVVRFQLRIPTLGS